MNQTLKQLYGPVISAETDSVRFSRLVTPKNMCCRLGFCIDAGGK